MKSTGIVRRIDDLGRVVIPKEIRRTLRIREGDPVEMFVGNNGELTLKKYSAVGCLGDFAKDYATSLHESTGEMVFITDASSVLSVAGASQREYCNVSIGDVIQLAMDNRQTVIFTEKKDFKIVVERTVELQSIVIAPIVVSGEAVGAVVVASREYTFGKMEQKMAETAASFLAKQIQD